MAYVQLDANGNVVGVYGGPQPGMSNCTDIADNDPRLAAFIKPGKPQQIGGTVFLNRFPQAKLATLATEAQTNPAYFLWFINCAAAPSIDLTDPQVQGGVNALVPAVLTAAEAATILDH